jgi:DNA modification methylase
LQTFLAELVACDEMTAQLSLNIAPKNVPQSNQIWHGDSLLVAQACRSASINTIYIDPPFGTGNVQRGRGAGAAYRDVDDDPQSFVQWLLPWLVESHRVLTETGSIFVHLDYRHVHYVKVALDQLFGRDLFINEIIWCYSVGGKSNRMFARKHDTILWYARSAAWAFYPEQTKVERKTGSHMKVVVDEYGQRMQQKTDKKTGKTYWYPISEGKIPEDWWSDIEVLNHSAGERTGWPSQKPEKLLHRIISATTKPGDVVADWFAGSGTTAAVAAQTQRNFIVADQKDKAIELITARLGAIAGCPFSVQITQQLSAGATP